ncbi:MAG: hypothetical protein Q7R95_05220, partial [bacterium]|nr:hypothetical protein [bacterium]
IKKSEKEMYIVETKGREDLDDPLKIKRLAQWCEDINQNQNKVKFGWLYIKEEEFKKYNPKSFKEAIEIFLHNK